jgi:putative PIN family toxin of toxin-antitoxin system
VISAVLDTNVLASGFVGLERPQSVPGELIRRWGDAVYILIVSDHILIELDRTFADRYFSSRMTGVGIEAAIQSLRQNAVVHPITVHVRGVATQPKDDLVVATAVSAGAAYLVTVDRPLQAVGQHEGVTMLSPRQFLDVLKART